MIQMSNSNILQFPKPRTPFEIRMFNRRCHSLQSKCEYRHAARVTAAHQQISTRRTRIVIGAKRMLPTAVVALVSFRAPRAG